MKAMRRCRKGKFYTALITVGGKDETEQLILFFKNMFYFFQV